MAAAGEQLFRQYHCSGCHGTNSSFQAPRLEGVFGGTVPVFEEDQPKDSEPRFIVADERYIRDSILLPKSQVVAGFEPIMPSFAGQISEEDLLKLIAYIKSIGRDAGQRAPEERGEQAAGATVEFVGPMKGGQK